MGYVYAEIELINGEDVLLARRHIIGEEEIKRTRVTMLVDSGAYMLTINENIQAYLQLPFMERKRCEIADGRRHSFGRAGCGHTCQKAGAGGEPEASGWGCV